MPRTKTSKGKIDVIVGLQYGGEGKNRIASYLCDKYDLVTPMACMPNHQHQCGDDVLECLPPCALDTNGTVLMGNKSVISPVTLESDFKKIQAKNPDVNLVISMKASLCLPTHKMLDEAYAVYKTSFGSARQAEYGAYSVMADAADGMRLTVADVFTSDFPQKYNSALNRHLSFIKVFDTKFNAEDKFEEINEQAAEFITAVEWLKEQQVGNIEYLMNGVLEQGGKILAIAPGGAMNDPTFSKPEYSYPVGTTTPEAISTVGVSHTAVKKVIGVIKAYTTMYSSMYCPGEIAGKPLKILQGMGNEYKCETGDKCGWIDLVQLKYACMVNGVTELAITKLDVLCCLDTVKAVINYKLPDGSIETEMPYNLDEDYAPNFAEFRGCRAFIDGIKEYDDLPTGIREYIAFIENFVGVPVKTVAYGADKTQTITK